MKPQPLLQRQKRLMTVAGTVMLAYLVFHMLSNLSFFDQASFGYFYGLYNHALVRWSVLLIIVLAVLIHLVVAFRIRTVNAKARTIDYQKHDKFKVPAPMVTGSILFLVAFIIIHILQTLAFDTQTVYEETVELFSTLWTVLFYLAGLFVLTMHLQNSVGNILQTLGKTSVNCHNVVLTCTLLLTGGFALIPLYIYFMIS